MDWLWSPWRYRYVSQVSDSSTCVFCDKGAADAAKDRENLVLFRGQHCYALLNLFPYTSGHLMIVPYTHIAELSDVPAPALAEMMELAQRSEKILKQVYRCDGLNIGMNLGKAAGAGIAGHIHLHVLPRWFADSNFMTTIGESRIIPEDLATTWEKLRPLF